MIPYGADDGVTVGDPFAEVSRGARLLVFKKGLAEGGDSG